jgi:hypothetical protein
LYDLVIEKLATFAQVPAAANLREGLSAGDMLGRGEVMTEHAPMIAGADEWRNGRPVDAGPSGGWPKRALTWTCLGYLMTRMASSGLRYAACILQILSWAPLDRAYALRRAKFWRHDSGITMSFRQTCSVMMAVALAAQPAMADTAPYFRMLATGTIGSLSQGGMPPDADPNSVPGTGELSVFASPSVRGRPQVRFRMAVVASNARGPVAWSLASGTLPEGLSLGPDGIVSGTPVGPVKADVVIAGVDAAGTEGRTHTVTITVNPLPAIGFYSTSIEAGGTVTLSPAAQNVFGSSEWSVTGDLPLGIALDPLTGRMSGASRQAGDAGPIVLSLVDADGARGESTPFSITVTSKLSISDVKRASRWPRASFPTATPSRPRPERSRAPRSMPASTPTSR